MDITNYKNKIRLTDSNKISDFIENICQEHNITYYCGAISVCVEQVVNLLRAFYENEKDKQVLLCFEQCVGGVSFSIECDKDVFSSMNFDKNKEIEADSDVDVFLISKLSDQIIVSKEGKNIELLFYVNGIEPELLLDRQEKIKQFYFKKIHQNIS